MTIYKMSKQREKEALERLAAGVRKQQAPDPIAELQAENARLETHLDDARTALDETNAERVRMRQALEQVEWVPDKAQDWWACPWCDALKRNGHKPDCARQAALQDGPKKEGE